MTQATELISDAKGYAGTMLTAAQEALGAAVAAADSISFQAVIPGDVGLPAAPPFGLSLTAPTLSPVEYSPPAAIGSGPTFQDIDTIDASQEKPAPFKTPAPTQVPPTVPSAVSEFRETLAALDLNVTFGPDPKEFNDEPPTLEEYLTPDQPVVTTPEFTAPTPYMSMPLPTDLAGQMQGWYHTAAPEFISMVRGHVDDELGRMNPEFHTQMARIEAQLTKYLDGGTGLNPAVEDAIYARARGKGDAEARRVRDQALVDAATRGFTMPTGALLSATQQARQAGADANARAASEIVVMQAEMEQKNLQFAVTTSTGLRTSMVNAMLSYMQNLGTLNGQALEYAKGILGAVVETYNAAAKVYAIQVDVLKTKVSVYEAQIKAMLADVSRYQAEIAGETSKAQSNQARVQAFTALVQANQSQVQAYKTKVEAEIAKASLQKLKVEVFQAQVQAFEAQVRAKASEWQGYTAAWGGEVAKVAAFKAEADAYTAQVQGYSAGVAAKSAAAQAQAMTNEARAKQYAAELAGYSAGVEAAGKVATTELENNRQEIVAFQAEATAKTAELNSYIEYYRAAGQIGVEQAKLDVHTLLANAEYTQKHMALLAQLHTANATVHANLAGSAMAGMNALAVEYAAD